MARYDIPMDEIESKLRSFKETEKQCDRAGRNKNGADDDGDAAAYEEERRKNQIVMFWKLSFWNE